MYKMNVKFTKLHELAIIPEYSHEDDSGFDFRTIEACEVEYGKITLVRTGLSVEMPHIPHGTMGHQTIPFNLTMELQLRAKSGLAAKQGIALVNGIGTIDFGYRGEILGALTRTVPGSYIFEEGEKFCQGVFAPVFSKRALNFVEVDADELSHTSRSDGGFGSTGTQ